MNSIPYRSRRGPCIAGGFGFPVCCWAVSASLKHFAHYEVALTEADARPPNFKLKPPTLTIYVAPNTAEEHLRPGRRVRVLNYVEEGDESASRVSYDDLLVISGSEAARSLGRHSFPVYQGLEEHAAQRKNRIRNRLFGLWMRVPYVIVVVAVLATGAFVLILNRRRQAANVTVE